MQHPSERVYLRPREHSSSNSSPNLSPPTDSSMDQVMNVEPGPLAENSNHNLLSADSPILSTSISSIIQPSLLPSPQTSAPPTFESFTFSKPLPSVQNLMPARRIGGPVPSLLARMGDSLEKSDILDVRPVQSLPSSALDTIPQAGPPPGGSLLNRIAGAKHYVPIEAEPTGLTSSASSEKVVGISAELGQQGRSLAARLAVEVPPVAYALKADSMKSPQHIASPTQLPPLGQVNTSPATTADPRAGKLRVPPNISILPTPRTSISSPSPREQDQTISVEPTDQAVALSGGSEVQAVPPPLVPEAVSRMFRHDPFAGTAHELPKKPTLLERLMGEVKHEQNEWGAISDELQQEEIRRAEGEKDPQRLEEQMKHKQENDALQSPKQVEQMPSELGEDLRIELPEKDQRQRAEDPPARELSQMKEDSMGSRLQTDQAPQHLEESLPSNSILSQSEPSVASLVVPPLASTQQESSTASGIEWLRQKRQQEKQRKMIASSQATFISNPTPSAPQPTGTSIKPPSTMNAKSKAILAMASARRIMPLSANRSRAASRYKTPSVSPARTKVKASRSVTRSPATAWEQPERTAESPSFKQTMRQASTSSRHTNLSTSALGFSLPISGEVEDTSPAPSGDRHRIEEASPPSPSVGSPRVKAEIKSEEGSPIFPPIRLSGSPESSTPRSSKTSSIFPHDQRLPRIPRSSPDSSQRRFTTVPVQEEESPVYSPEYPTDDSPAGQLPPPLWPSEADAQMSPSRSWLLELSPHQQSGPEIGVTEQRTTSQAPRIPLPPSQSPPKQVHQLPAREYRSTAVRSTTVSDPRLARLNAHRNLRVETGLDDQFNVPRQHPSAGPLSGPEKSPISLRTPEFGKTCTTPHNPSPSFATSSNSAFAGASGKECQVPLPTSANRPEKPSHLPPKPVSHSRTQTQGNLVMALPDGHPLAGPSYEQSERCHSLPSSAIAENPPNSLGLTGPPRQLGPPTPSLPSSSHTLLDFSEIGRKRERTSDFEPSVTDMPPSKRHLIDPPDTERPYGQDHSTLHSSSAREARPSDSSYYDNRDEVFARGGRGRGRAFPPRGRGRGAPRGRDRQLSYDSHGLSGRPNDIQDPQDARNYDAPERLSSARDRYDRDEDRPVEYPNSHYRRSQERYHRGGPEDRRFSPPRDLRASSPPRGPHYFRDPLSKPDPFSNGRRESRPQYDDDYRYSIDDRRIERNDLRHYDRPDPTFTRHKDTGREEYSRYDRPQSLRRSRSPPPKDRSRSPRSKEDSRQGYKNLRLDSHHPAIRVRTPPPRPVQARSEYNQDHRTDRPHEHFKQSLVETSHQPHPRDSISDDRRHTVQPVPRPLDQSRSTLDERRSLAATIASEAEIHGPAAMAQEQQRSLASRVEQVGRPLEYAKQLPPTSPRSSRRPRDEVQYKGETDRKEATSVDVRIHNVADGQSSTARSINTANINTASLLHRVADPQPSARRFGSSLSARLTDPVPGQNLASRLQAPSRSAPIVKPTPPRQPHAAPSLLNRMG